MGFARGLSPPPAQAGFCSPPMHKPQFLSLWNPAVQNWSFATFPVGLRVGGGERPVDPAPSINLACRMTKHFNGLVFAKALQGEFGERKESLLKPGFLL